MAGEGEAAPGLAALLERAARDATRALESFDAFWRNPETRIPLPTTLEVADAVLRPLGLDRKLVEFQMTLNRAASRAMPKILPVFLGVISRMTWKDARAIVKGPDDAATRYFETASRDELRRAVRPIVSATTEEVDLTRRYKDLERIVRPVWSQIDPAAPDLDDFVADHALTAFFFVMSLEERKLRKDPVGRVGELLGKAWNRRR